MPIHFINWFCELNEKVALAGRNVGRDILSAFETERKALLRPAENRLPKLAPLRADRNFGTNASCFPAIGIFEHESNVTICFDFYANEAASEVIPFLFSCDSRIRLGRQRHIRLGPFPLANLRWRN